jgi:elongation factor P--(R)-beta-lysine ligase
MMHSALILRAQVVQAIRQFFVKRGFLEVETPLLIPANAPEDYIDPIAALPSWQLQTSPEICMKRLLCRGHQRIFQISHCWRADERGSCHLSEFTMLEWYRADADYHDLMDDCIGLLRQVAQQCTADGNFTRFGKKIDPKPEWEHISVQEACLRFAQADALASAENDLFDELLVSRIEPALENIPVPVIMTDYPAQLAALSRTKVDDPRFAERFELYLAGLELANGFSELNNPQEQRARFVETNRRRAAAGRSTLPLPERFLNELSVMPPSAGIALGVDRLVMLVAGLDSIDDVVAFRPEEL